MSVHLPRRMGQVRANRYKGPLLDKIRSSFGSNPLHNRFDACSSLFFGLREQGPRLYYLRISALGYYCGSPCPFDEDSHGLHFVARDAASASVSAIIVAPAVF